MENLIDAYSDGNSIIDRMIYKKDMRVRVKTMTVIENLLVANTDIPEISSSRI